MVDCDAMLYNNSIGMVFNNNKFDDFSEPPHQSHESTC